MSIANLTPFQHWIVEIAQANDLPVPDPIDPLGLEFEVEGRLARVTPHSDDALALIEIEVHALTEIGDEQLGNLALQLLRINQEARFEHCWQIVLDDDDIVGISTTVTMATTQPEALASAFDEGLERAKSLGAVVSGFLSPAFAASQISLPAFGLAAGVLRL
jgi:hypothetical protein